MFKKVIGYVVVSKIIDKDGGTELQAIPLLAGSSKGIDGSRIQLDSTVSIIGVLPSDNNTTIMTDDVELMEKENGR